MNRCPNMPKALLFMAVCVCLALAGALFPAREAQAQSASSHRGRIFPQHVRRGAMQFIEPMQVLLNGNVEQLAPGVRVYNQHNLIVMTSTLVGPDNFIVNYLRDPAGAVRTVWLLTPFEASAMPDGSPVIVNPANPPGN
ncbi:MAG: hypothetical protein LBI48_12035 [Burkholderiaceae bacterium]|jgi:hypothetical protein|nr:hypothetical protein [Burkholderiaceae bacterium]